MFTMFTRVSSWKISMLRDVKARCYRSLRKSIHEFTVTVKVIPLKLFYYQTFFETWRNEHS